ncbi:MAG: CehA/McbA family metallohydrolase [Verrucomicrobiae bacterium]|nr:CehA/McbA family metallohydrolase [Verrucomicrobiae bacterium]
MRLLLFASIFVVCLTSASTSSAQVLSPKKVEAQPLAANAQRLIQALEFLGSPLPKAETATLRKAISDQDAHRIQEILDPQVLVVVSMNPEVRVKSTRGPADAHLQQHAYTPVLLKILNDSTNTAALNLTSPQAGPVYHGEHIGSLTRQGQLELKSEGTGSNDTLASRFLQVEMFRDRPMTPHLSGLEVEYAIALIYATESGKREATLAFDVGEGTQDLGFRGDVPVLFDIRPAVPVRLRILDHDGESPTTARLTFLDAAGRVYPPQAKRLAPDFFFQKHLYRADGETVLLPPGEFTVLANRGPEYRTVSQSIIVSEEPDPEIRVQLERWFNAADHGFYSGDHHIHASGCAHYTSPSIGVEPQHMLRQVKGEGLNVGCVLTWGPGFDHQQQFFSAAADQHSEPLTLLKYDIEVSGFGSQALGHVCLINLKDQIYPGATGSENWPTWTTPVLKWAKAQGAVTGYAHSGSGLQIDPDAAAIRLIVKWDLDGNGALSKEEFAQALLPEPAARIDVNQDGILTSAELMSSLDRAADRLPNLAIPELNSVGAQEIFVTTAHGLCDFISAMDTARIREWNCWYHLLNCGFPLKVSGETDFPCMSGTRVGQGRVYVELEPGLKTLDFPQWTDGLREGRSYVSDGYGHCPKFSVNDAARPGDTLDLDAPGEIEIVADVAFGSETPIDVKYGGVTPLGGRRLIGDTVVLYEKGADGVFSETAPERIVEIVMNGESVASIKVPADDQVHTVRFKIPVTKSSWVALRQFPQLHTNPVTIQVAGKPIRASRDSAQWCLDCIEQLWTTRGAKIAETERAEARRTFDSAISIYERIRDEATE